MGEKKNVSYIKDMKCSFQNDELLPTKIYDLTSRLTEDMIRNRFLTKCSKMVKGETDKGETYKGETDKGETDKGDTYKGETDNVPIDMKQLLIPVIETKNKKEVKEDAIKKRVTDEKHSGVILDNANKQNTEDIEVINSKLKRGHIDNVYEYPRSRCLSCGAWQDRCLVLEDLLRLERGKVELLEAAASRHEALSAREAPSTEDLACVSQAGRACASPGEGKGGRGKGEGGTKEDDKGKGERVNGGEGGEGVNRGEGGEGGKGSEVGTAPTVRPPTIQELTPIATGTFTRSPDSGASGAHFRLPFPDVRPKIIDDFEADPYSLTPDAFRVENKNKKRSVVELDKHWLVDAGTNTQLITRTPKKEARWQRQLYEVTPKGETETTNEFQTRVINEFQKRLFDLSLEETDVYSDSSILSQLVLAYTHTYENVKHQFQENAKKRSIKFLDYVTLVDELLFAEKIILHIYHSFPKGTTTTINGVWENGGDVDTLVSYFKTVKEISEQVTMVTMFLGQLTAAMNWLYGEVRCVDGSLYTLTAMLREVWELPLTSARCNNPLITNVTTMKNKFQDKWNRNLNPKFSNSGFQTTMGRRVTCPAKSFEVAESGLQDGKLTEPQWIALKSRVEERQKSLDEIRQQVDELNAALAKQQGKGGKGGKGKGGRGIGDGGAKEDNNSKGERVNGGKGGKGGKVEKDEERTVSVISDWNNKPLWAIFVERLADPKDHLNGQEDQKNRLLRLFCGLGSKVQELFPWDAEAHTGMDPKTGKIRHPTGLELPLLDIDETKKKLQTMYKNNALTNASRTWIKGVVSSVDGLVEIYAGYANLMRKFEARQGTERHPNPIFRTIVDPAIYTKPLDDDTYRMLCHVFENVAWLAEEIKIASQIEGQRSFDRKLYDNHSISRRWDMSKLCARHNGRQGCPEAT